MAGFNIQNNYGSFSSVNTSGALHYDIKVPDLSHPNEKAIKRQIHASQMGDIDMLVRNQHVSDFMGEKFPYKNIAGVGNYVRFDNTQWAQKKYPPKFRELYVYGDYSTQLEEYVKGVKHYMLLKSIENMVALQPDMVVTMDDIKSIFMQGNMQEIDKALPPGKSIIFDNSIVSNVYDAIKNGNSVNLLDAIDDDIANIKAKIQSNKIVDVAQRMGLSVNNFKSSRKGVKTEYPVQSVDISFSNADIATAMNYLNQRDGVNYTEAQVFDIIRDVIIAWADKEPVSYKSEANLSPTERTIYGERFYAISDLQTTGSAGFPHFHVLVGDTYSYVDELTGLTIVNDLDSSDFQHSQTRLANMLNRSVGITMGSAVFAQSQQAVKPSPVVRQVQELDDVLEDVLDEEKQEEELDLAGKQPHKQIARFMGQHGGQYKAIMQTVNSYDTAPIISNLITIAQEADKEEAQIDDELEALKRKQAELELKKQQSQERKNVANKEAEVILSSEQLKQKLIEAQAIVDIVMLNAPLIDNAQALYNSVTQYANLVDVDKIDAELLAELQLDNPEATEQDITANMRSEAYNKALFDGMEQANNIHGVINGIMNGHDTIPHEVVAQMEGADLVTKLEMMADAFQDIYTANIALKQDVNTKDNQIKELEEQKNTLQNEYDELEVSSKEALSKAVAEAHAAALEDKKILLGKITATHMSFPGNYGEDLAKAKDFDSVVKAINNVGNTTVALTEEIQTLQKTVSDANTEVTKAQFVASQAQSELNKILTKLNVNDADLAILSIEVIQTKNSNFMDEQRKTNEELASANKKLAEQQAEIDRMTNMLTQLQTANTQLQTANTQLKEHSKAFEEIVGIDNVNDYDKLDEAKKPYMRKAYSEVFDKGYDAMEQSKAPINESLPSQSQNNQFDPASFPRLNPDVDDEVGPNLEDDGPKR